MKNLICLFLLVSGSVALWAQTDSLEMEIQKKQLEIMKQELDMKKQELDMKVEEHKSDKEERLERKQEMRENKKIKQEQKAEIDGLMESNTIISMNPLSLFVGGFELGIEKRVNKKEGLRFSGSYFYNEEVWYYNTGRELQGGKLNLQYRFYLKNNKPGLFGLYVGPEASVKTIQFDQTVTFVKDTITDPFWGYDTYIYSRKDTTMKATAASLGIVCGVQGLLFRRLTYDFHFGANVLLPLSSYDSQDVSLPFVNPYGRGSHPRFSFTIGVPF
ncbi:MAG: trichohyalin-plectin-homology domain domain-containing protein [Cytophagaceae bacterium]|jgi:hypothetical protein|nr:trichohyalin-plectin-homology domain domain-containing protein [Cytophagaceae bacterium]